MDDLVALAADGQVARPRSPLGAYLSANSAELDALHADPLATGCASSCSAERGSITG